MVDKAAANKAKNAGNIAFKAKDFDTAITSYNTAIELDPDEVRDVFIRTTFFWPQCLFCMCLSPSHLQQNAAKSKDHGTIRVN